MNLPSVPSSAAASSLTPVFSPVLQFSIALRYLEEDRIIAKTTRNVRISRSLKSLVVSSGFPYPRKKRFDFLFPAESSSRRRLFLACVSDSSSGGKHNFNTELASSTRRGAKNIVIKRFSDEDANIGLGTGGDGKFASSFREDPIVDKLRTQLGVIHPLPSPPISGNVAGLFVIFFFFGVLFDKLWTRVKRARSERRSLFMWPQLPTASISTLLEKDLPRKESVEWVNMVLGKLWKVYKGGIENWIIGLLQPVIDDLEKPDYVQRVEIKQFSLGDAPLSVRSVERKTSRRANDLQYQIGIRYTGDARILLMLSLKFGIIPIAVPVGVRDFDIDGVLWVKLQLIPTEPWVGAVQWAFVSLPKIKFELSPFRLFNLMAIPVVSMFLTKLLTEDLPRLFVRPKKIVLDFQKGQAVGPVTDDLKSGDADDLKSGEINEKNNDYSGELSVTLVDACNLSYMFYGKTDPYVILKLGDQTICSKKNSQTTVIGPPGEPIWNQDFYLLVTNPHKQKLSVEVRDSIGFTEVTIGTGEVDLSILEDTVPTDRIIALKGGWGLFTKGNCGEILLRLTYRAYVEDEEDDWRQKGSAYSDVSEDDISDLDEDDSVTNKMMQGDFVKEEIDKDSFMDVLAALIVSEEFQGIVASETGSDKTISSSTIPSTRVRATESPLSKSESGQEDSNASPVLLWLAVITSVAVLIAINISGSSIFNP